MYPLLVKDGLILPYWVFFCILVSTSLLLLKNKWSKIAILLTSLSILGLTFIWHFITPPQKLPDLHTLFIMDFSFLYFFGFYLYFSWQQFKLSPSTISLERKIQ